MKRSFSSRRAVIMMAAVVGACSGGEGPEPRAAWPPSAEVINVAMREHSYRVSTDGALKGGRTLFRVRNLGRMEHELHLVRLPADLVGRLGPQLRAGQKAVPAVVVARLRPRPPGSRASFAVDIAAGAYGIVCLIRDGDGKTHASKGMYREFSVG